MQFFILYKSFAYSLFESQILCDLAFLLSFHVPRMFFDHCSTILISYFERLPSVSWHFFLHFMLVCISIELHNIQVKI